MRSEFVGYYAPTETEYERLWNEGTIVLDTNVLLDLYRLPAFAQEELLSVLEELKSRIWIPYQVALEFQKQRLNVIWSERKSTEDTLSKANQLFKEVHEKVASLQMDKRGLGIDSKPVLTSLQIANDKLSSTIKAIQDAQIEIAVDDPIRERIDRILDGRVGPSPTDQADLNSLTEDGSSRYDNKIPPGFMDAEKENNRIEATFYHDGLAYSRQYGDLILWRQTIKSMKERAIKTVIIVTSDQKEDWWWREKGKTVGPRPELTREITKLGEVELFWMYSSGQFLENAKKFLKLAVSDLAVTELNEVSRHVETRPVNKVDYGRSTSNDADLSFRQSAHGDYSRAERAVSNWLTNLYDDVRKVNGYPDFIVSNADGLHGYDIKVSATFSKNFYAPVFNNSLLRGYLELNERRLSTMTLIVIIDEKDAREIMSSSRSLDLNDRLRHLLDKYPITEIMVGYVDPLDNFNVVSSRLSETRKHGSKEY